MTRLLLLQCGALGARNVLSVSLSIAPQFLANVFVAGFNGAVYNLAAASANSRPTYVTTSAGATPLLSCPTKTIFYNSASATASWVVGAPTSTCMSKFALKLSAGAILYKTTAWVTVGSYGVVCGSATATRTGE